MTYRFDATDKAGFLAQLDATFREELGDRLGTMQTSMLELERAEDPGARRLALDALARDAHSLKGGGQLVGRVKIAALAHALESRLERLRDADHADARAAAGTIFAAVDAFEALAADRGDIDIDELVLALEGRAPRDAAAAASAWSPVVRDAAGDDAPPDVPPFPAPAAAPASAPRSRASTRRSPVESTARAGDIPIAPSAAVGVDPEPARPERATRQRKTERSVRVPTERLDAVLAHSGDLLAVHAEVAGHVRLARTFLAQLDEIRRDWSVYLRDARRPAAPPRRSRDTLDSVAHRLDQLAERLQRWIGGGVAARDRLGQLAEAVEVDLLGLRLVPVELLFASFPKLVRDLAEASGKRVDFQGLGWDTPIDRDLLERLRDPVMHLLRNSIAHGIESPAEREAAGKPLLGVVMLEASARAGEITLEVRDDGRGIDRDRIRALAATTAWPASDDAPDGNAAPSDLELGLIFQPGFSTAEHVGQIAGRGIGLDVVRTQVSELGGSIDVRSESGRGTRFLIRLPLTLIKLRVIVVTVAGRRYGLPTAFVERVLHIRRDELVSLGDRAAVDLHDGPALVASLAGLVGAAPGGDDRDVRQGLLLSTARGRAILLVDAVVLERDVVLKDLGSLLGIQPLIAGAAILEHDELLLVLDAATVVERAHAVSPPGDASSTRIAGAARRDRTLRVLVVDDSVTTRALEKNILTAAGFDVHLAVDGLDALRLVRSVRPDVIVSDVEMPRLDGFGLTERLRADEATRDLPVILVTGAETAAHQLRGFDAGADAYIVKSEFDQDRLIRTIWELVP